MRKIGRKQEILKYKNLSKIMLYEDDYKCSFEDSYTKSSEEKRFKKSFEAFCNNFPNIVNKGFGIYMSGEPGTGKSHYTNCIYNELKDNYIVFKTSILTLFDEIYENFGKKR